MELDVSILLSTRNRIGLLKRQFEAFDQLDTDGLSFEVVVVDNGSSDGSLQWLQQRSATFPLVSLSEARPGKNRALNRALSVIRGNLILFTDDDTIPVRGWVKEYHSALSRWPGYNVFCGPIEPLFPPQTPSPLTQPDYPYAGVAFSRYRPAEEEGVVAETPFGPNYAVRASVFREYRFEETIGPSGSHYPMGSESEFLNRLRARGECYVYLPSAGVGHMIDPSQVTRDWLRGRGFRFGWGNARLRPDRESPRLFGVPRYLWRKLLQADLRDWWYNATGNPRCWTSCVERGRIRGTIHEYRTRRRLPPHAASAVSAPHDEGSATLAR